MIDKIENPLSIQKKGESSLSLFLVQQNSLRVIGFKLDTIPPHYLTYFCKQDYIYIYLLTTKSLVPRLDWTL